MSAAAALVRQATEQRKQAFIYVNNRLEGNALATIDAMVEADGSTLEISSR